MHPGVAQIGVRVGSAAAAAGKYFCNVCRFVELGYKAVRACVACCCRREPERSRSHQPLWFVLEIAEEEQLVLDDRTTDLPTETIVIESRVRNRRTRRRSLRCRYHRILGIQIAVLEVLIELSVERVRSALDGLIELST